MSCLKKMVKEDKDMCGTKDKPCCTCFCGNGGCLASMREDFYMPATKEQVRERLENGSYPEYRDVMKTYLKALEIAAEAEADANKKIAESLTPELIEKRKIDKWDGSVPAVTGSGTDSMLVDISGLINK